ncbi:GyrI-like domain-containing protein [Methanobrevibacter olleyae]|uniref:Effector-binding domain-containing protein n=1 Tax=Methanobrevibacter olleyae TaxID=294671 RepID=A0A126R1P0_METOL|nr:GyrI-like domain-containing protein [Methanobrevibacter olleyae]AMK15879.1 transcriptional regulator [Methanobrevibacter olleyae]SFL21247.1 effector-binding domain-containing protein [Methanobrevibacter olleyae]
MEIVEKTIEDQKIAIMNYKGSLDDMEVLISKLIGWSEVEEIETIGDLFAIFYNNPRKVKENEVVYDVGIPINPELDPDDTEEIKIVTIIEHKVLSGIHNGSLDNIQESYNTMAEYSVENKYDIIGSPKEIYIKNKFEVDNEEDMVTEIQLPVIKMG